MDSESSLALASLPAGHLGVSWEEPCCGERGRERALSRGCLPGGPFLLSGVCMAGSSIYSVFKGQAFILGPWDRGPVSQNACLWAPHPRMQPTSLSLRGGKRG